MSEPWRLQVMPPARRQLSRLPDSVAPAILETLQATAVNPDRVGKRLTLELEGPRSARRGPYRVVYVVDDGKRLVSVTAIGHRRDVYRS